MKMGNKKPMKIEFKFQFLYLKYISYSYNIEIINFLFNEIKFIYFVIIFNFYF
jgi:hypothetical protein